jgi:glycosyltransferase involved in cell wall biosynthesis
VIYSQGTLWYCRIPEAIANGENGLLVAPEAEKIAETVDLFLRDREHAKKLGRCAKRMAEERLTWENAVERFLQCCIVPGK